MKTVSLVEALASGKKFRFKMPKENTWVPVNGEACTSWSKAAIIHAECQIIEKSREIWVWQYPSGNLDSRFYTEKAGCEFNGNGWGGRPVKFREVLDE